MREMRARVRSKVSETDGVVDWSCPGETGCRPFRGDVGGVLDGDVLVFAAVVVAVGDIES